MWDGVAEADVFILMKKTTIEDMRSGKSFWSQVPWFWTWFWTNQACGLLIRRVVRNCEGDARGMIEGVGLITQLDRVRSKSPPAEPRGVE